MLSFGSVLIRARVPSAFLRRATSSVPVPVIRVPRRSQLLAEKRSRESNAGPVVTPRAGKLLISARRRELNQPAGETCGQWVYPALVSKGWKHRLSRGDYFTIERQNEQCPGPNALCTFQSMALDKEVIAALSLLGIKYPTWVQTQAIPVMLSGKNILCAAETGSGKTLGYLLPIIQQLLTHKTTSESQDPCNLILVPSRELANQVSAVATNLGAQLGLTVSTVGGGRGLGAVDRQLSRGPVDILVATPGALWKALKRDTVSLASLRCVVLDEVDTLFDNTFSEVVESILMQTLLASERDVHGPERKPQLVAVGATFPRGVLQALGKMIDLGKISTIKSKRLHFLMPHVQHTFMKLKGEDKVPELLNILKKQAIEGQGSGVLVFCNSSSTVNWLGYILDDHLIKHSRLQGLMPAAMRSGIFQSFQKGDSGVLICTDLASRGLDSLNVNVVVNYDFPATLQDYLHRAGRVGRLGSERQGSVVSFVTHLWDVELVQKIETAARKRSSLFGMESGVNDSTIKDPIRKEIKETQPLIV